MTELSNGMVFSSAENVYVMCSLVVAG